MLHDIGLVCCLNGIVEAEKRNDRRELISCGHTRLYYELVSEESSRVIRSLP